MTVLIPSCTTTQQQTPTGSAQLQQQAATLVDRSGISIGSGAGWCTWQEKAALGPPWHPTLSQPAQPRHLTSCPSIGIPKHNNLPLPLQQNSLRLQGVVSVNCTTKRGGVCSPSRPVVRAPWGKVHSTSKHGASAWQALPHPHPALSRKVPALP